ncbi:hypothetical protein GQ44DRAFT_577432, partial [Phaeosphaeriaceae sp. PMI808]
ILESQKPQVTTMSAIGSESEERAVNDDEIQTSSIIQHPCEKCGQEEVRYYTRQLRGADEGTTVFYSCDCGHKY